MTLDTREPLAPEQPEELAPSEPLVESQPEPQEQVEEEGEHHGFQVPEINIAETAPTVESHANATPDERMQITEILSADLLEVYRGMDQPHQVKFDTAGDKLVGEMQRMLHRSEITPGRVMGAIEGWLSMIPNKPHGWVESETRRRAAQLLRHMGKM